MRTIAYKYTCLPLPFSEARLEGMGLRAVFIGNDLDELGVTVRVTVAVAFAVIGDMVLEDAIASIMPFSSSEWSGTKCIITRRYFRLLLRRRE